MTPLPPPPAALLDDASLFLDFDGTLVELAGQPDAVAVDRRLATLMTKLRARFAGRLALLSGRSIEQLRGFLGSVDGMAVGGSHGLELLWADGRSQAPAALADPEGIHAAMGALAARHPGLLIERKSHGAALHYRQAPQAEREAHALAAHLAEARGLTLQPGKMMIEIRAGGADKGSALTQLMAEPGMAGTAPIFIGDDLTDEPGFRAAAALGGAGILVGVQRETAAAYRLNTVGDTLSWLEQAVMEVPA